jgi:hypothetical protein
MNYAMTTYIDNSDKIALLFLKKFEIIFLAQLPEVGKKTLSHRGKQQTQTCSLLKNFPKVL